MALAGAKVRTERQARPRRMSSSAVTGSFLDACARLLARTRSSHRGFVVRRLGELAVAADLGIIGLEEWLDEHVPSATITSDRHRTVPLAQGEVSGPTVTSRAR